MLTILQGSLRPRDDRVHGVRYAGRGYATRSVPEVVSHGRTGLIVDRPSELPRAVELVCALDSAEIRAEVETRFTADRMVEGYLHAYRTMVGRQAAADAIALAG
jgi:hypothetical protein